jgi:Concanavalin A-like lectin/glucanases superfamily
MAGAIQVVWQGAAFAQSWPNLVSLWKLDETDGASFADSGPADVAMAFGGPWADLSSGSLIEGDDGTSAYTDGSGYATIPAGDPDHDLAELTISFYYQRQSAAAKQILLAAGDGTQVGDFSIEVLANGRLRGWHTGEDAELRFFDSFDGIAGTNLAVGTAHRIEVTFGPAGTRIYLDGVPLTHAFILDNHNGWNNARVKHLGRWTDGVLNQAIGVFDGLRLWDRQLTAAQVSTLEPAVATIVGSDGAGVGDTLEVPKAEFLVSDEANPGPITKFVSRQDRGNGSGVSPDHAQELQAALSGASPGQTFLAVCQTPGTIEYWHYPNGLSFPNGSANNPITLQARQGDGIVISKDEEFAGARVPNSGFWTQSGLSPDDISKKIWRSSATFSTGSTVRLYGVWREFAHLHHMLPYASLSDLRATYGTADTPTNYGTPGAVLHTDGRVYIRMQKPHPGKYCVGLKWQSHLWPGHPEAVSGGAKNYPVTEDPNDYPIHLFRRSFGIPAFDLASGASGGWIKIGSGINSCGYERVIRSGHHIVMRRGTDIAWRAFVMDGGSAGQPSNFDVQRRRITNGSLRIAARDEWKFGGWLEGERGAFGLAMDTARDMYFKDCTIAGYHELWVGVSDKLRFRNCVIFDILDDGIQSGSGMSRTEIGYCFILNAAFGGMGQAGAQSDPNPGGWLFHHNIIDARTQKSSDFGKHTTPPFLWLNHSVSPSQPWKNYNNLLFFGPDVEAKQNCGLSHLDNQNNTSGVPHEVFNNIIIRHDTQRYTNELGGGNFGPSDFACKAIKYDGTSNERWDFNLYYRDLPGWSGGGHVDGLIKPHARNGSVLEDYNSIALWKASNGFQTSKGLYAPGFENSGSSDRPGLPSLDNFPTDRFKYRPTAQTQVTTATTTSLSGANWWSSPPSWGGQYFAWNDGEKTLAPSPWKGALDPNGSILLVGVQDP